MPTGAFSRPLAWRTRVQIRVLVALLEVSVILLQLADESLDRVLANAILAELLHGDVLDWR